MLPFHWFKYAFGKEYKVTHPNSIEYKITKQVLT